MQDVIGRMEGVVGLAPLRSNADVVYVREAIVETKANGIRIGSNAAFRCIVFLQKTNAIACYQIIGYGKDLEAAVADALYAYRVWGWGDGNWNQEDEQP